LQHKGLNSAKRVEGQILRPMEQKFQDEIKSQFKSYAKNTVTKPKGKFLQLNLENKMDELTSPYCCQTTSEEMNMLFDAEVGTKLFNPKLRILVRVLLDSESIHANLINEKIALQLVDVGARMVVKNTSVKGFGPNIVEITHSITTDVIFSNEIEKRSIVIRALVSKECNPDLIIGLPTMQCYNLFPLLQNKIMTHNTISDICSSDYDILYTDERIKCLNIINDMGDYHPNLKDINNVELNEIVQNLQKLDFFNAENDDDDIPDESDLAFMSASNQIDTSWKDVTFEGTSDLIHRLRKLCAEYSDVFAYKISATIGKGNTITF